MTDFTELVGMARVALMSIEQGTLRAGELVDETKAIRALIDECARLDTPKGKHLVRIDDEMGMWTVAHPMACRQSGLFDCRASGAMLYRAKDVAVDDSAGQFLCDLLEPLHPAGRWRLSIVEAVPDADQRPSA